MPHHLFQVYGRLSRLQTLPSQRPSPIAAAPRRTSVCMPSPSTAAHPARPSVVLIRHRLHRAAQGFPSLLMLHSTEQSRATPLSPRSPLLLFQLRSSVSPHST